MNLSTIRRCVRSWSSPIAEAGAAIAVAWGFAAPVAAAGNWPALTDRKDGVTCEFFHAGARLAWERPGGDWRDAAGQRFGSQPFASATVSRADEFVSWDLTRLSQHWLDASAPPGFVILRPGSSSRGAVASFDSREAPVPATAATLALRWDDGAEQRLTATTDTFTACPTHRSLGSEVVFRVADGYTALLGFPVPMRAGRRIVQATLVARSARLHGRSLTVEAFAAAPPAGGQLDGAPGISDAYQRDRGLERNPDVLLVERFDTEASVRTMAEDPATRETLSLALPRDKPGFEPVDGSALRVRIRKGTNQALNRQIKLAALNGGTEPEEAFFRYHLRLGDDWDPVVDGGKLPGFAGTYGRGGWGMRPNDGSNGWSARGSFFAIPEDLQASAVRGIGTYAYTATTKGQSGEVWGWNRGPTGLIPKSRWTAVEQQVRMNEPGQDNGIMRVWIDGQLAFERTNIRWRTVPDLKVEAVWFNVYHGGTAKADRDMTLYIDNLVIARKPIGPGRFDKP